MQKLRLPSPNTILMQMLLKPDFYPLWTDLKSEERDSKVVVGDVTGQTPQGGAVVGESDRGRHWVHDDLVFLWVQLDAGIRDTPVPRHVTHRHLQTTGRKTKKIRIQ